MTSTRGGPGRRKTARGKRRGGAPRARVAAADAPTRTLRIDRLAAGGDAVATRDDGKTVFVEDAAPGDVVRVRILEEHKRFARARIDAVLEPSADRVEPRCRHFGVCGGCRWQHIDYAAQVGAKSKILRDALERIGGFSLAADPAMTSSPLAYGYRGRARVRVQGDRVGFLERASHRLCAIDECPVLVPELESAVLDLAGSSPHEVTPEVTSMEANAASGVAPAGPNARRRVAQPADESEAAARAGADGEWSLCAGAGGDVSLAPARGGAAGEAEARAAHPVFLDVAGERIGLDALAFSQANPSLHAPLVERVLALLLAGRDEDALRRETLLEVHAGVGFFTCAIARVVARVVAVESDAHACRWLERNLASLAGRRATVEVLSQSLSAAAVRLAGRLFDAVLLDPPRTGLAPDELAALVELAPRRIVYLSCDPATLARDARGFREAGYELEAVEGFDLFPQTPHTEGLIGLVRG